MNEEHQQRPIVCGTDFSAMATEALDVAAAIARRLGTKLVVAHVEEFSGMAALDPSVFKDAGSVKQSDLEKDLTRLRDLGTNVEVRLLSGSVFDELITLSVSCNARFIVVGATGHALARRLLVGSVAERTAEMSPIPTLVLRPGTRLASWVRGEHSLKILVGYDFSPASDAALRWVRELQQIGPCETTVLHINWPPDEAQRLGYHGPLPLNQNPTEIQNLLERDLAQQVAEQLPPEHVTVTVESSWGNLAAHLFAKVQRDHIDLVVVGTHHRQRWSRLRFGSVSRSVLHQVEISVAVVPPLEEDLRRSIPRLERVLVATDFSELGNSAVPYGCAILQRGGSLKILHVMEPTSESDNSTLHRELTSLVPSDARNRFRIEPEIVASDKVAEAIQQAAERFDADVVCLGSHGRSGLARTLLGSIAQAVMASSRRPVLVVRKETP